MNLTAKFSIFMAGLMTCNSGYAQTDEPSRENPYFGQQAPGQIPKVFASGVVSVDGRSESGVSFSEDLTEMYFSPRVDGKSAVHISRFKDGSWTKPEKINLTDTNEDSEYTAMVGSLGRNLYFSAHTEQQPGQIWSVSRDQESREPAKVLDSPINDANVSLSSQAWNLAIYFNNHDDGKLYIAPRINRQYPKIRPVKIAYGTHGFISPSMDYLLVEAHKDNNASKDKDIIVYFKHENGTWSEPVALGAAINTTFRESNPTLTPDGKYLFFSRYDEKNGDSNVYWVSADIIENAKAQWLATQATSNRDKAPEVAEYDVDNLSYGAEQSLPNLVNAWIDPTPPQKNDAIPVGKLDVIGAKQAAVLAFARDMADDKLGDFDSLLIAHKGKLVFESYYKKGRANLPHFQASATKGYTAMIVARAMQMGYLSMDDLHKPVVDLISGLDKTKLTEGVENITLHHTMSMQSGVRVSEEQQDLILANNRLVAGSNLIQEYLQHSDAITPESQTFSYQGADPSITMQVVDSVVPGPVMDFIDSEVLSKLAIKHYGWRKDVNGAPTAGSGAAFTSRDMLKMGEVVLNKGKWQGQQLFSAELLEQATRSIVQPPSDWMDGYPELHYGYYWYTSDVAVGDKTVEVKLAWGAGGNRVIVVEDLELVIALTGFERDFLIMHEIETRLLPAFIN